MLSLRMCKWFFKSLTRNLSEYLSSVETTCLFFFFFQYQREPPGEWKAQEAGNSGIWEGFWRSLTFQESKEQVWKKAWVELEELWVGVVWVMRWWRREKGVFVCKGVKNIQFWGVRATVVLLGFLVNNIWKQHQRKEELDQREGWCLRPTEGSLSGSLPSRDLASHILPFRVEGAASLGRGSRDCLLTPAKWLLFPEVVFKAEKESGLAGRLLAGRFVQERAPCTLGDNHASVSLFLPLPFSLLPFPFSLSLMNGSLFHVLGIRAYGWKTQYHQSLRSEEDLTEEDSRKGEGPPWRPQRDSL